MPDMLKAFLYVQGKTTDKQFKETGYGIVRPDEVAPSWPDEAALLLSEDK